MKIGIICANGKAGSLIVKEAVANGFDVTAIVRGQNKSVAKKCIIKDVFDLTYEDLKNFDVIVNAFGAWTEDTVSNIYLACDHIAKLLRNSKIRYIIVGGAGSLYVNSEHTVRIADGPDFPDIFKPVANAHDIALKNLRKMNDVDWTYVSPACDFRADGPRTGNYLIGGEELLLNDKGESIISYADYAIAIVDEIANGNNIRKRISVVQK